MINFTLLPLCFIFSFSLEFNQIQFGIFSTEDAKLYLVKLESERTNTIKRKYRKITFKIKTRLRILFCATLVGIDSQLPRLLGRGGLEFLCVRTITY